MGELFRSREMTLCQLYLQTDSAYACVRELGELGKVHFRDLNPDVSAFQREYVNEVRRCDEMERKLRFLSNELERVNLTPTPSGNVEASDSTEMIEMEAYFEDLENEVKEVNAYTETLKKNLLDLVELRHIIQKAQVFFETAEALSHQQSAQATAVLGEEARGPGLLGEEEKGPEQPRLMFVAGVIAREKLLRFEQILWRACRGNVFVQQTEIDEPLKDPSTGECVFKNVFVLFFQRDQLRLRVKRICDGFRATLYECPATAAKRREMALAITGRIDDLNMVLHQTQDHSLAQLEDIACQIEKWKQQVIKIKAIYHTMNKFNLDVTDRCLIAECWCPVDDLDDIQQVLMRGTETNGGPVPSILHRITSCEEPPTYMKTNRFTKGFQAIVDAYGIALYKEVNPALYTIIMFPFLFAVMFGDAGHGLILSLLTFAMILREKKLTNSKAGGELFSIIFNGRYIIFLMGLFSIYTGLIYNDIFSKSFNIFGSRWNTSYQGVVTHTDGKQAPVTYVEQVQGEETITILPNLASQTGNPYLFGLDPRYIQVLLVVLAVVCVPWMLAVKLLYLFIKNKRVKSSKSILSPEEYEDTISSTKQLKSPKSIESLKSKFMDSVATFSEKKKILQKSSLVSGSQSLDPKEPGDPSTHELEHEEQLDQLCWIPFGIQSLEVDQTGGRFSLEPEGDRLVDGDDVTLLKVPEGAVAEKRKVQIRYGIIMDGPLVAPDGYKLASPVVYIHYNSEDIKSPITLHLPHWSADTDRVKMMMAPHSPLNDEFTFVDYEGAGNGRDFLLTGHCTLFTKASLLNDPFEYFASTWKWESKDTSITTRIAATYKHNVWIQILEKYWKVFSRVGQPYVFKFLEGGETLKCKLEPGCHGVICGPQQIEKEDIVYQTGNKKKLKDSVKVELYPPFLTLVPKLGSTSRDPPYENVSLQVTSMDSFSFYCNLSTSVKATFSEKKKILQKTDTTWIEDYQKAIDKRGSVLVKVVRAIFCGSPEVGKSSLKYNLVYGKSKEVKISTGVAESPEVVIATNYLTTGSDADWIPVDEEVMEKLVRTCTNRGDYEERSTYPTPSFPPDKVDPAISSTQVTPSTQVKQLQDIRDDVLGKQDLSDLNLKEATFIHFLDSGGQPSFQDSLPFLLTMPCTYIQVFNASEDLKEEANITFRSQDGHAYKLPPKHGLTSIDLMLRSFSSIYTAASKPMDPRIKGILRSQPELQMFLVGTFKDKLFSLLREDREARLKSIVSQLNHLEGKPYYPFIVKNDDTSRRTLAGSLNDSHDLPESVSWPFIINNMMRKDGPPSEEDIATLKALRSKILSASKKGSTNGFELDMPLTWFLLYVITCKNEQKFIQYDQLKEFCIQSIYLDHEDANRQFEGMLTLFHMLGFYAFFDHTETTREWICTDITTLYGEFANLLTVHLKDSLYFDSDAARLFHRKGIICQADFEELFNEVGINEAIPKKWLLEVIHHLGLAAKYQSDPEEYFMPLVLPYGKVKVPERGSVENLCFAYKYLGSHGRIDLLDLPRGIFCRLVVQLSEQAKGSNLKPQTANCDQTTAAFISGGVNIYLMEKPGRLELQVECSSFFYPEKSPSDRYSELHKRCKEIRSIVHSTIQEISSKMMDGMPPDKKPQLQVGFLCRCDSTKPAHLALVEEDKANECLVCQLEKRRPFDEEARIWFEPVSKGQSDAAVSCSTEKKIRIFLSSNPFLDYFHSFCDVRRISHWLQQSKVLEIDDLEKMIRSVDRHSANTSLNILLNNDPSLAKLKALSNALREDNTHGCHEELADRIDQFIATI